MSYTNLSYYQHLHNRVQKKPAKVDAVHVLKKTAGGNAGTGWCCLFTCFCCICNSPYWSIIELGHHWKKSLKDTYEGIKKDVTNALFHDAMGVLCDIQKRCEYALQTMSAEVQRLQNDKNSSIEEYNQWKLEYIQMRMALERGAWFHTLMRNMYDKLCGYGEPLKYIMVSDEEKEMLCKALPMFFPVFQRWDTRGQLEARPMNPKVIAILRTQLGAA